jgi:CubicO group peptidase (beta-lactamase class C family)
MLNLRNALIGGWMGVALLAGVPGAWAQAPAKAAPTATAAPDAGELARFNKAADYSAKLDGHAVLIQRGGRVIFERYDNGHTADRPHPLASGTKSFTGVAAMFAVQDGLLTLDELASDTLTEWKSDPKKSKITVRQLLNLSSGIDPGENGGRAVRAGGLPRRPEDAYKEAIDAKGELEPGARFRYGPNHFYAFGALLERKLAKSDVGAKKTWDYYNARIFAPIGLQIGRIGRDKAGHPNLPGGCMVTAREWVKFGQLVLNKGAWTDDKGVTKQLLKPELLAQCFEPSQANPSYGLTWWLRKSSDEADTGRATPEGETLAERLQRRSFEQQSAAIKGPDGQPVTVWMAAGLGKQRLYVLPQFDMVVVRFGDLRSEARGYDDREFLGAILGLGVK